MPFGAFVVGSFVPVFYIPIACAIAIGGFVFVSRRHGSEPVRLNPMWAVVVAPTLEEIVFRGSWKMTCDSLGINASTQIVATENPIQPFSAQRNIVTLSWDPEEK